jgi:hypothetical protein
MFLVLPIGAGTLKNIAVSEPICDFQGNVFWG